MLYVCLNKVTQNPLGTAEIADKAKKDWEKKFVIREVGEEYRGKQVYEMKFVGDKLRLATQQEKESIENTREANKEEARLLKFKKDMQKANALRISQCLIGGDNDTGYLAMDIKKIREVGYERNSKKVKK